MSLALGLRLATTEANRENDIRPQLTQIEEGLVGAVNDLRELSHGIHPAILSEGGLRPALATLARRSPIPVELSISGPDRLPEPIEVGVYYVVSETLTNVVKHARASVVHVGLETDDSVLRVSARDDGVGGADPGRGSGILGLMDRVHALGGRIEITSPPAAEHRCSSPSRWNIWSILRPASRRDALTGRPCPGRSIIRFRGTASRGLPPRTVAPSARTRPPDSQR